jgi:hypothetical protein
MRLREAVASALHLLVISSFFALSFFFFVLPLRPDWRLLVVNWLSEQPEHFYWLGAIFALIACLFVFGFYGVGRGRFLRLIMKPHVAIVDAKLLKEAIEECFRTHFPRHVRGSDIAVVSKQRLDVAVDLLPLEENRQLRLMREMEKQLCYLLRQRFGYSLPFTLSIHSK